MAQHLSPLERAKAAYRPMQSVDELLCLEREPARRFGCGHPRTTANTKRVRNGKGQACLQCFRQHNREYVRRKRAKAKSEALDSREVTNG